MSIELSIVSGTVNRNGHLTRFLESIWQNTDIEYELILLNAGDSDIAIKGMNNTRIIREQPRLGFAKGYNRGFKEAKGKYVVYLNDDVEVTPHWAIEAVRFMDENPWCGLGAIYFSESGQFGPFQIRYWLNLPYANFGILSKKLGDQIGWIDEFLYTYGSDNSLTFKTLLAGYGVAGIPRSKIYHNPIIDANKVYNMQHQEQDARNLLLKYRPLLPQMYDVQNSCPKSLEYV